MYIALAAKNASLPLGLETNRLLNFDILIFIRILYIKSLYFAKIG
jgi:hypothetical protein